MKCSLPMLVLLVACDPDGTLDGTSVGNPGKLGLVATEEPADLVLTRAEAEVGWVFLRSCAGPEVPLPADQLVDVLGASDHPVGLLGGTWCGLEVELAGLLLEGTTDGGTTFQVELEPEPLVFDQEFHVDGEELLVGLPLVVSATDLEELGDDVQLPADDDLSLEWAEESRAGSDLWADRDGDGLVGDADDRVADGALPVPVDTGHGSPTTAGDMAGCGCTSGGLAVGWLALVPVVAIGRQRR